MKPDLPTWFTPALLGLLVLLLSVICLHQVLTVSIIAQDVTINALETRQMAVDMDAVKLQQARWWGRLQESNSDAALAIERAYKVEVKLESINERLRLNGEHP